MATASLRFNGSLNWFLPARRRNVPLAREFEEPPGIADAIQALGVPHTEVDLVLIDGRAVGLDHRLAPGELAEVFGPDRPPELAHLGGLMPAPPEPRRFVLDGHLGRLARYLRMLGFDSRYDAHEADAALARVSADEDRILLTRDRGLLKRSIVRLGYLVRDDDPRRQLAEVVERYGLAERAAPFSRCVRCNGQISPIEKAEVADRLAGEPRTLRYFDAFGRCAGCGAIYWPGSHYERMNLLVGEVVHSDAAMRQNHVLSREDGR